MKKSQKGTLQLTAPLNHIKLSVEEEKVINLLFVFCFLLFLFSSFSFPPFHPSSLSSWSSHEARCCDLASTIENRWVQLLFPSTFMDKVIDSDLWYYIFGIVSFSSVHWWYNFFGKRWQWNFFFCSTNAYERSTLEAFF